MDAIKALSGNPIVDRSNMKAVYQKKSPVYKFLKRLFDILLSGIALVCLSPVFLITGIAIKLEDGGPAFFTQPRAGKDMKPFKMYKFRSMYLMKNQKIC